VRQWFVGKTGTFGSVGASAQGTRIGVRIEVRQVSKAFGEADIDAGRRRRRRRLEERAIRRRDLEASADGPGCASAD
jgi:hypothetical protein